MKLCPKQPDLIFTGRNLVLRLCTLTLIQSVILFVISNMCVLWQKERKWGGRKKNQNTQLSAVSHIMAKLPPPAVTSVIFGGLNSAGDAPGADRSRIETHSTAHPQTHR